jgi:putative ATPase
LNNLFNNNIQPLAERMRPKTFSDVLGQSNVINYLSKLKSPKSFIFYGPPGTGKTTVAKLLSNEWKLPFIVLNAVHSGVKEIKELFTETTERGQTLLFLDEIHRFNSAQQDTLLEGVENGKIVLIGATTENPGFRINKALLSRCNLLKFFELEYQTFFDLYKRIHLLVKVPDLNDDCINYLIELSSGDVRRFLNFLDTLASMVFENPICITDLKEIFYSETSFYKLDGEDHYDCISAFIKSLRGSDPDAALLYLAKMIDSGEDPIFILRRLAIFASEDIGNASVYAMLMAESTFHLFEKIGMPEGRILLGQLTVYCASCPKSNTSYTAIDSALEFVKKNRDKITIPNHLKNAPTSVHKKEGNSLNYKYPHNYNESFILENYFPDKLKDNPPQFYFPSNRGHEKSLKERLNFLWKNSSNKNYDEINKEK